MNAPLQSLAEANARAALLEALLTSPRGDLARAAGVHRRAREEDPRFYGHLATWHAGRGALRDHGTLFLGELFASTPAHREAAFVLAQRLRTFQLADLMRHLKAQRGGTPRTFRSAVRFWLRRREAVPAWWEECCLRDKASLKSLYAGLHVRPSPLAQAVLFEGAVPPGSRLAALRELARGGSPSRAAALVRGAKLPFTTALGALRAFTPEVLVALVEVMSPAQFVTHLHGLMRRGLLDSPEGLALARCKLVEGARDRLLSDLKLVRVSRLLELPRELERTLKDVAGERLGARGTLDVPTAILVDKSGSMESALDAGKALATLCSAVARAPLYVWAFDQDAFPVVARGTRYEDWERAFDGLRASGATSIGAGLAGLLRLGERVEQLVLITDGQENTAPSFAGALQQYAARYGTPQVTWLEVGQTAGAPLEPALAALPVPVLRLRYDGDDDALPNLVPLLSPGGRARLVEEVLTTCLPTKGDLAALPPGFDPATLELL